MLAVAVTLVTSVFVQAACGAVYSIVPLIQRRMTGQIAGMAGAHGNAGAVLFLTVLSFVSPALFFVAIAGVSVLAFVSACFLDEPRGFMVEVDEKARTHRMCGGVSRGQLDRYQPTSSAAARLDHAMAGLRNRSRKAREQISGQRVLQPPCDRHRTLPLVPDVRRRSEEVRTHLALQVRVFGPAVLEQRDGSKPGIAGLERHGVWGDRS